MKDKDHKIVHHKKIKEIEDQHGMGWIKSKPDPRDMTHPKVLAFWQSFVPAETLPTSVDLRSGCVPVMDQGSLGSCTACAADALCGYRLIKEGHNIFQGSRLATYFWTRLAEGSPNEDSGAEIRDTIKTIADYGLADEKLWPYDISKFTTKPTQNVVTDAAQRKAITYVLIDQPGMSSAEIINAMKQQLAAGNTMEFGTYCYQSIFSIGPDGMIAPPKKNETPIGGHALHIVGFSDDKKAFLLQNSWGLEWGDKGFGWLPYSYFETGYQGQPDASDVWVILVENWPVPTPTPTPTPVPPSNPDIIALKDGNFKVYVASIKSRVKGNLIVNGKDLGDVTKISRGRRSPVTIGTFKKGDGLTFSLKLPDGSVVHNVAVAYSRFWEEWSLKVSATATGYPRPDVVLGVTE
jgi:C1A family cysteine protease